MCSVDIKLKYSSLLLCVTDQELLQTDAEIQNEPTTTWKPGHLEDFIEGKYGHSRYSLLAWTVSYRGWKRTSEANKKIFDDVALYVLGYLYGAGTERLTTEAELWWACNGDDGIEEYIRSALTMFWNVGYLDFYYSLDSSETRWKISEDALAPDFYERREIDAQ